jgi:hypothetical protein
MNNRGHESMNTVVCVGHGISTASWVKWHEVTDGSEPIPGARVELRCHNAQAVPIFEPPVFCRDAPSRAQGSELGPLQADGPYDR